MRENNGCGVVGHLKFARLVITFCLQSYVVLKSTKQNICTFWTKNISDVGWNNQNSINLIKQLTINIIMLIIIMVPGKVMVG